MKYIFNYFLAICFLWPFTGNTQNSRKSSNMISIATFGAIPNDGNDDTPGIRAALEYCKKTGAKKLIMPTGNYDFWPDRAWEEYMSISNNDEGLKRIAFPLFNMSGFKIDGRGSKLIFHGYICPFVIKGAASVVLKNFSIDYVRTFHSEGKIIAVYRDSMAVSFSAQFPFKIQNDRLIFTGEKDEVFPYSHFLEFDPVEMETAYMAPDYWSSPNIPVKDLGQQTVRLYLANIKGTVGNVMVFGIGKRLCPAITISDSRQIKLSSVQIYHSGSMGIIAQRSANIVLKKISVTPSPTSGRMISVPADATHFVNCTGSIIMDSCVFENQMDDATNIHGIYAKISKVISPDQIEIQFIHRQQFGFDLLKAGDSVEFVRPASLLTFNKGLIKQTKRLNKEYTILYLEKPVNDVGDNDVSGSSKAGPSVTISNCFIGKNRARGLLLGSRSKIVVEKNTFHTSGSAILFKGDASFWYEQAGVKNVVIRNNVFDNCNYGIWGTAAIQVTSGINGNQRDSSRYNRNMFVTNNTFKVFDPRLVNIYSVDNFSFINNTVIQSGTYINQFPKAKPFVIQTSSNVHIKNNPGIEDEINIK